MNKDNPPGIIELSRKSPTIKLLGKRAQSLVCGHECSVCGRCHAAYCGRRTVMCAQALDVVMHRSVVPEDTMRQPHFLTILGYIVLAVSFVALLWTVFHMMLHLI